MTYLSLPTSASVPVMTRAGSDDVMVALPYGFTARRRFTQRIKLRAIPASVDLDVEFIDGRPMLHALGATCDEPLEFGAVSHALTPALLDLAVRVEMLDHTETPATFPGVTDPSELHELLSTQAGRREWREKERKWVVEADRSARASRDSRRVTSERLRRVLDLYETKGIGAVIESEHTTERNARRLIARARAERKPNGNR